MTTPYHHSAHGPDPPPSNKKGITWTEVVHQVRSHLTHPIVIFGAGAICSLFVSQKLKEMYHRHFIEPYLLRGAFRDSALHIRSTYRIIENCLLSEVHVENSTLIVESGVIHKLHVNDNSTVILNGGLIKGEIVIMGKNSTVKLMRDSIVEADIFVITPQQLQQKSGLLRGNIHIIVVQKQDGSEQKRITVTNQANSTISQSSVPSMQQLNQMNNMNQMNRMPQLQQMPQRIHPNSVHSRATTNDLDNISQYQRNQTPPRAYSFQSV